MDSRITFLDYTGNFYEIIWFKREQTPVQAYIDRVIEDKGTIEAIDCINNALHVNEYYDFKCSASLEPLSFRWHGDDRYSPIRGSEITFRVLIQNDDEAALMIDMLNGGYYVNVLRNYEIIWIGKCEPSFYTEAYKQYPYTLEVNASDQLGGLKQTQPLMIDFPLPWPNRNISMMDFLNFMLTQPDFNPPSYRKTAPTELLTSTRLWYYTETKLLEETYFDPLVFMDADNDQYLSYYEIITKMLQPLFLTIIQWEGKWYVISLDAMWNGGNIDFGEYNINSSFWEFTGVVSNTSGVLDLYNNPQHQQMFNNAQMSYLAAWRKITFEQNFQRNNSVIDAFANRNGQFYYGQDGIQLEWDEDGRILNHWTYEDGNMETIAVDRNSGKLLIPMLWAGSIGGSQMRVQNIKSITDIKDGFNVALNFDPLIDVYSQLKVEIKLNVDGTDYWFWNNDDDPDTENFYGWAENYHLLVIEPGSVSIATGLPSQVQSNSIGILTVGILRAEHFIQAFPDSYAVITNVQISLYDTGWKIDTFTTEGYFEINPLASFSIEQRELIWGISNTKNDNDHSLHFSTPYDIDRNLIPKFRKAGIDTGELYKTPIVWLLDNFSDDNSTYSPQLKATFRNTNINPFRLIYDFEKRVYGWQNAEWQTRGGFWNVTYTAYKAIRNLPDQPVKCDFSTFDFNNDFCTEIASGYLYDYLVRVADDGGVVEAASCVQDAINELNN